VFTKEELPQFVPQGRRRMGPGPLLLLMDLVSFVFLPLLIRQFLILRSGESHHRSTHHKADEFGQPIIILGIRSTHTFYADHRADVGKRTYYALLVCCYSIIDSILVFSYLLFTASLFFSDVYESSSVQKKKKPDQR
jgi:hypothetical protein